MARVQAFLTLIAWNIYVGTTAKAARNALREMIKDFRPEVFGLMEAANLYGDLHGLGYEVIQLKPRGRRHQAAANVAIMVRRGIPIKGRFALRMKRRWKGPKLGLAQDPRIYRWVKIVWAGRVWKIGVAHTPFGAAARKESNNALVKWFKSTLPGRPTVLLIDANMLRPEFEDKVGDPAGAEVETGHRIDLVAYMNCVLENERNLGKGPSDHPAMLYDFVA